MVSEITTCNLYESFKKVTKSVLAKLSKILDINDVCSYYTNYPVSVSFLNTLWPETKRSFPNKHIDLQHILSREISEGKICIKDIDGYDECIKTINNDEYLRKKVFFPFSDNLNTINIVIMIANQIINRYISTHNSYKFVEEKYKDTFFQVLNSYLLDELQYDVCVPILMLTFQGDFIEISENCHIEKMSEKFIQSKYAIISDDAEFEKNIAGCATHMLVIRGKSLKNYQFMDSFKFNKKSAYPMQTINKFFASIFILTKQTTGYIQLIAKPTNNWISKDCNGNLFGLTGFVVNEYPKSFRSYARYSKYFSNDDENHTIQYSLELEIIELFLKLMRVSDKNLDYAIEKLLQCKFNDSEEERILNAVIGLEYLLGNGERGDLKYKISCRMATISTLCNHFPFSPAKTKDIVFELYNSRSKIVHSTPSDLKQKETNKMLDEWAIIFLKDAIRILAKHPKYLNNKYIDELMMQKLEYK